MADLTPTDKRYLEHILKMGDGFVLDYHNVSFGKFFDKFGVDIHGDKYLTHGTSKANKMRAFWEQESDALVGQVLSDMLEGYNAMCELGSLKFEHTPYERCCKIVDRLCGKSPDADSATDGEFSDKEFKIPDIQKLPVDSNVYEIIRARLDEARRCLSAEAYLSAVIMCGSVLEAVLLGAAKRDPKRFNLSERSPKKDGKAKPFPEWRLADFIDVARDVGLLKADAQSFSHGLRDFRNYIHPAKQAASDFAPRKQTAKLCLDALEVALADVADGK